jgi:SAM-dependent methyltransferase
MFRIVQPYNWLIYSCINSELRRIFEHYARGRLIDVGCGEKPYRDLAASYVDEHIGVDHEKTAHDTSNVDAFGTAYQLPFDGESFDTVLCTDVLEHLEEPSIAVAEAWRVLRAGGHAIYTAPMFWHLHEEPRDYYRFTKYGLEYLFVKNGFEVVEIKALSGFILTFAQELVYFLYELRRGGIVNPLWWLIPPAAQVIQGIAYVFNKFDRSENFSAEYAAVVRKPIRGTIRT